MKPEVSIIIRCRNNWKLTKRCIDSIRINTICNENFTYKIIVVNDGSTDETLDGLKDIKLEFKKTEMEGWFIVINHLQSLGAVTATNTGLKYVFENPTPYILILDNDVEILEGNKTWLSDMIKYFEEDEAVGAVGVVSNNVSSLQHVSQLIFDKEPKFLISFVMMISYKCAKAVGCWDERFNPMSAEDLDFSIRATRLGYKLKIAKDVFINHFCHQTLNQNWDLNELTSRNKKKLLAKWGERIYYSLEK